MGRYPGGACPGLGAPVTYPQVGKIGFRANCVQEMTHSNHSVPEKLLCETTACHSFVLRC